VAERQTVALDVVGSTPTTHPNFSTNYIHFHSFRVPHWVEQVFRPAERTAESEASAAEGKGYPSFVNQQRARCPDKPFGPAGWSGTSICMQIRSTPCFSLCLGVSLENALKASKLIVVRCSCAVTGAPGEPGVGSPITRLLNYQFSRPRRSEPS
jgi:hypothetical protein